MLTRTEFAPVDGARIGYAVYGDVASGKTPLLVLHGSLMSAEAMSPMIGLFVASRPVIAIDARGHGRTGENAAVKSSPGAARISHSRSRART